MQNSNNSDSASPRRKFGDVEHYLKNGICSSLLSNFIWSINKMAINLNRATAQEGDKKQPDEDSTVQAQELSRNKISPLLFSIQHFGLPILQLLVSFILIAARVVDTPLVILTTPMAVLVAKDKRWDVFLACGKNFSQGIISIPFMVWGAFSSIFVLFYDFFKGKSNCGKIRYLII